MSARDKARTFVSGPCFVLSVAVKHFSVYNARMSYEPRRRNYSATGWQDDAICKGMDPDIFFWGTTKWGKVHNGPDRTQAKAVCAKCPVRRECLDYAIDNNIMHGTWGGTNEDERASLRRRRLRDARVAAGGVR